MKTGFFPLQKLLNLQKTKPKPNKQNPKSPKTPKNPTITNNNKKTPTKTQTPNQQF